MLTDRAAKQLLAGLEEEDADNCYCMEPECEWEHPFDDDRGQPPYGVAFVKPNGEIDKQGNAAFFGLKWGNVWHLEDVQVAVQEDFADCLDEVVIIDRSTGQWWDGASFPG